MFLTRDGQSHAVILIGSEATWLERHAAEELQAYIKAMSGAELPIRTERAGAQEVVAIGRPGTNPLVAEACRLGRARLSTESPGLDGFIVRATDLPECHALVLGGSQDRGTLYAVYALLEEVLNVGFFRDGERVPRRPTIELVGLDIRERPRFAGRHDGNGCMYHYSALCWTWEDWRRELDWKAKRRANCTYCFHLLDGSVIGDVLDAWGVPGAHSEVPPQCRLHEPALEYARRLGIRVPCNIPPLNVTDAMLQVFPGCRYITTDWSGFAPTRSLSPGDPLFRRYVIDYVRRHTERFGSDHLYFANFLSESRLLGGAEGRHQANMEYAGAMSEALLEADPQAVWLVDSWSFDLDSPDAEMRWSPEQVREYLDAISVPLVAWDLWSEEAEKHKRTGYFGGKPWGFGVLHSFGGSTYLQGDIGHLVEAVQDIDRSQGGPQCVWFSSAPEIVHHNGFYFELAAWLSWDPSRVTVADYVERYAQRRYGTEGAEVFRPVFAELLASAYGPRSGSIVILTEPLYWFWPRPGLHVGMPQTREEARARRDERVAYIPRLRCALELLSSGWHALDDNAMAERDLVDIARLWIAERFNMQLRGALAAFEERDRAAFERCASECLALLDHQARLLASWSPYRLDTKIQEARPLFGEDACRAIKHAHAWVTLDAEHESLDLLDYYRMDLDGLVRDYYRPRVAAYLDELRRRLDRGEPEPSREELEALCVPFANAFVAAPYEPMPAGESPMRVVRELLERDAARL